MTDDAFREAITWAMLAALVVIVVVTFSVAAVIVWASWRFIAGHPF